MDTQSTVAVLLVDDNSANLLAMSAVLERMGADVVTARSGPEALKHLLSREFCTILMDVQMPGLNGFETVAIIRQRPRTRDVPVIFVTAISRADEHVSQGYQLGAVDYLFKPVLAETLRAKVAVFIDIARKRALIEEQARALQDANDVLRVTAAELHIANRGIASANRELETFTSAVAHDLRAPLRGIAAASAVLLQEHRDTCSEDAQELLARIHASAGWMGTLIDDLLHLSHVSLDAMRREPVNLSELARSCIADLVRDDPERRVTVRIEPDLITEGDSRLLRIALNNLLNNAWKFSSKKASATIEVGRYPDTGAYFVRDDGAGFDMAYASALFGAFQRLHRVDEFEGNGIGLITVKRVIERHGGELSAYAELEKGATFTFTLPLQRPTAPATRAPG